MRGIALRFCGCVIAMPVAAWLLPGVHTVDAQTAWMTGLLLGAVYLLLRPIAKILLKPLSCLTFGIFGFVVDTLFVQLAAQWMTGFKIDSFLWAAAVAILVAFLREGLGMLAGGKR